MNSEELGNRLSKLKEMLERIKVKPEYYQLEKQFHKLENLLPRHGFHIATKAVVVAKGNE